MKVSSKGLFAALAVAGASVLVALAYFGDLPKAPSRATPSARTADPLPPRRAADPTLPELRRQRPLLRLSPIHVGVRANGFFRSTAPDAQAGETARVVRVLFDTGSTHPMATPDGKAQFSLRASTAKPLVSRGFSGAPTELSVIDTTQALAISLDARTDPNAVLTPIEHLVRERLSEADLIVPPQMLAPKGGVIQLDLANDRFATCETLEACSAGSGWLPLGAEPCPDHPELYTVEASLGPATVQLMLDTGGVSLVTQNAFDRSRWAESAARKDEGHLVGSGGSKIPATRYTGRWTLGLGEGQKLKTSVSRLWVVDEGALDDQRPCAVAGSIGIDWLDGCELVLAEGAPANSRIRCELPAPPEPGRGTAKPEPAVAR